MKLNKETIEQIFIAMDYTEGADTFLQDVDLTDEEYDFVVEHYNDFYGIWDVYRRRRVDEMCCVLDTEDELDGDEVLDYYNHLPSNN